MAATPERCPEKPCALIENGAIAMIRTSVVTIALLGERLGRQVVVDNRPGAEGMIGTDIVARANPDGYTLLMASTAFTMNPAVVKKLPYDPIKDFDWAAMFGRGPVIVTVS